MLSEGILADEEFVFLYIRHHRIRPVEHWGLYKKQIPFADIQGITCFYGFNVPPGKIVEFYRDPSSLSQ